MGMRFTSCPSPATNSDTSQPYSRETSALPLQQIPSQITITIGLSYFACLRVATSKITAPASTMPLTMFCASLPVPIRFMPLVSETYTSAPINDPTMLPTPPAAETPPMKAAAMASNSNPAPAAGAADLKREAYMMPASAASMLIEQNTMYVMRLTLMPLNCAASGFTPTA